MSFRTIQELAQSNSQINPDFKPRLTLNDLMSRKAAVIISCVDPRADPKDFWGITPGAPPGIVRNAGGRAVDALRTLEVLAALGKGLDTVAVVHHTECGVGPKGIDDAFIRRTLQERKKGSTEETGGLQSKQFETFKHSSEEESVKEDMRLIQAHPLFPKDLQVLGFVLNVETNTTSEVLL
ncbi:hypothetical protein N0V90_002473 [Kalmusia sp. IMI 367209]|nr:hypothetical protein N0V90_002473 [Kalmusia sp. IMI 367209]